MKINKEHECEVVKKSMSKTQKDWVNYFNNKGEKMVSAPDIYRAVNKELIESLKGDFEDDWEVTSTRIIYNKDNLNAEIIHDADSKITKPKQYKVKVPVLNGNFEENKETEKYLQALFDTKDSLDKILKTLKKFGKDRKIRLWTPTQSQRKDKQVRSVGLYFGDFGRFYVDGDWFDSSGGYSRGVIIDSAKQSKFFSNKAIFDTEEETITIPMKKTLIKEIEKKQREKKKVRIKWDLKTKLT